MKKFLTALLCAIAVVLSAVGLAACGGKTEGVYVYMPDGAPALSMAKQMTEDIDFGTDVNYNVVNASTIQTFVTGENPKADMCVLPVNLASKLLGGGTTYKMLGTVTHGNLYILKKAGNADITVDNLSALKNKTVGVVQLAQVPGLTFKLILKDNGIEYNVLDGGAFSEEKVNLKAVTPEEVIPASDCDYFVVPEPAATTKANKTPLEFAGDLQALYGGTNGYPQAVLVAKNSLLEKNPKFVASFVAAMKQNAEWLLSDGIEAYFNDIVGAINAHMETGSESSLNVNNLNKQVVAHCAVNFVSAAECKTEVITFLDKLIAVDQSAASTVSDNFFYTNG